MGFPRIISKNNKIYTKLGELCLSSDGHQFWIVCHTCQEELQTQDNFWKHIQDEHNFMHGFKHEGVRTVNAGYLESADGPPSLLPIQLYRKVSGTDQQRSDDNSGAGDDDMQKESKDYTEMRIHNDQVSVDIKMEPASLPQSLSTTNHGQQGNSHHHPHLHSQQTSAQQQQQQQQQQHHLHHQSQPSVAAVAAAAAAAAHMEMGGGPLMYQLPQAHPPVSAYAALVQAPTINTLNMTVAAAAAAAQVPTSIAALLPQDSKDAAGLSLSGSASHNNITVGNSSSANNLRSVNNNGSSSLSNNTSNHNTTNNNSSMMTISAGGGGGGGSTVSSDDGERWYICEFENCGLKFKYQSRLELHRSVHSRERRFACEICGASFKQSCNLSTHRKKKHALRGVKSSPLIPAQRF